MKFLKRDELSLTKISLFFTRVSMIFVTMISLTTLVGWWERIPLFTSYHQGFPSMAPNSAVMLLIGAFSFFLQNEFSAFRFLRWFGKLLSALVIFISAYTFAEHLFDQSFGIDSLVIMNGQRPSVQVVVELLLCGVALFFFNAKTTKKNHVSQVIGLVVGITAEFFLIGYMAQSSVMYGSFFRDHTVGISLPTVICLCFMSVAFLSAHPKDGFIALVFGKTSGGVLLRKFFWLIVVIFPIVLTVFIGGIQKLGFRDHAVENAMSIMFTVLVFTFFIWRVAKQLENMDEQRKTHEILLTQVLNESLDFELTLEKIVRLSVRKFCDWCVLELIENSSNSKRIIAVHRDPVKTQTMEIHKVAIRLLFETDHRSPILNQDLHLEKLRRRIKDEVAVRAVLDIGIRSYITAPLQARGHTLGTITFVSAHHDLGQNDLRFAEEIATRAALAMDNARLYEEAKTAVLSREDTIAIVSHDLKNPIAAIKLTADLVSQFILPKLNADAQSVDRLGKHINNIGRSARKAERLISDLLDFVKIESGNLRLEKKSELVSEIFEEVVGLMRPLAEERGLKLVVRSKGNFSIRCDRFRVIQSLMNLIGNAIKFSPPGETIELSARLSSENEVLISVIDHGPGIDPQTAARIFERYWQPEHSRFQGTGLGLSIVKGIVESHGGKVWVESVPGQGSTFLFTVPVSDQKSATSKLNEVNL